MRTTLLYVFNNSHHNVLSDDELEEINLDDIIKYDIEITKQDTFEYCQSKGWFDVSTELTQVLKDTINENFIERLVDNPGFVKFLKDKYRNEALNIKEALSNEDYD